MNDSTTAEPPNDEELDIRMRATALTLFGVLVGGWLFAIPSGQLDYFGFVPALFCGWAFGGGFWRTPRVDSPFLMALTALTGPALLGVALDVPTEAYGALVSLALAAPFVYLVSGIAPVRSANPSKWFIGFLVTFTLVAGAKEFVSREFDDRKWNDHHHVHEPTHPPVTF